MAKSKKSRVMPVLVLVGAVVGLMLVLQASAEQRSWASAEGTVLERYKSKSASVKVEYPLPDGRKQVATLSENGPIRDPGTRVTVRYELRDGQVVDAALADNDEAFWVMGVMAGVLALGALGMTVRAWTPVRKPE